MAKPDDSETVRTRSFLVSSLATADALAKLSIEKGLVTETECLAKLSAGRATYQAMLKQKLGRSAQSR